MSSGFLGCWVNDCSGYHIGYIAGIVCLFFGIVLYLTSHYFETSLDLDKTSLDFKNESYKEIKMCFSSLGYSISLVCLGAVMGVEYLSLKALFIIVLMLYITFIELYRPSKYPFQQRISFNKAVAYPASAIFVLVIKGAWFW
jgi:hypothetical protein